MAEIVFHAVTFQRTTLRGVEFPSLLIFVILRYFWQFGPLINGHNLPLSGYTSLWLAASLVVRLCGWLSVSTQAFLY